MLIDLYSAVIGGIIGGLVGFMTCILMAVIPKGNRCQEPEPCQHPYKGCMDECERWPNCNEWEG